MCGYERISEMQYWSKNGIAVKVCPTWHALNQMWMRWNIVFPERPITFDQVLFLMEKWFSHSRCLVNLSHEDRKRIRRHNPETMFFRNNAFTFVVCDSAIITVEISDHGKRYLNQKTLSDVLQKECPVCPQTLRSFNAVFV